MKRYVGALANRDRELMRELRSSFGYYGVEMIDLEPGADFDETPIRDHKIEVILPKLKASGYNKNLFDRLREIPVRFLNSLDAVEICQSRTSIYTHIGERLPRLAVPSYIEGLEEIQKVLEGGKKIFIRRDAHHLPREERVLGFAGSMKEMDALIADYPDENLFLQEYIGRKEEIFKAYVIGRKVYCLRKTGIHEGFERDRDLSTEQVALDKETEEMILDIGRVFDMNVYGVDYYMEGGKMVVFDVNDFPSYGGIPDGADTIAQFVCDKFII